MTSQFDNMDRVAAGREATLVKGVVGPWIEEYIYVRVTHLVAAYRSKDYTHDDLVGKVAEISALRSLLDNLESLERQGNSAMEREHAEG